MIEIRTMPEIMARDWLFKRPLAHLIKNAGLLPKNPKRIQGKHLERFGAKRIQDVAIAISYDLSSDSRASSRKRPHPEANLRSDIRLGNKAFIGKENGQRIG